MNFRADSDRALCLVTLRTLSGFRAAWVDKDGNDDHGRGESGGDPTGNNEYGKTPQEKTKTAMSLSDKANKSMAVADHIEAMRAHNIAGTSHYVAVKAGVVTSKGKEQLHVKIAKFHEQVARELKS